MSDHSTRRQTAGSNGQGQSFDLSSSSADGDDPLIWEQVVTLEFFKQAAGYMSRPPIRYPRLTLDHRRLCPA